MGDGVLKPPMSGVACENIRTVLRMLGYEVKFGNQYDEELAKAVLRFQTDNKQSSLDGFVGPGTRRLLIRKLIDEHATGIFNRMTKPEEDSVISILFLAADPTDASRLRLGEEFREIQEKLKLAKLRERFRLELPQLSVRPADISQALLDVQPQIVHFSGHGASSGALCFENQVGQTHLVQPDALAALFEQFAHQVNCVLLNACYSEDQAKAIAEHIEHVIGMNQAIGDEAAIAFAIGFYQALGAGRAIEDAYKLGCVQIRLQGISEHLTPILITKQQAKPIKRQSPKAPSRKVSLQAWNGPIGGRTTLSG